MHVDDAYMLGRHDGREDGPTYGMKIDADSRVETGPGVVVPVGTTVGEGRRHVAALGYRCENCDDKGAFVFSQHKGQTIVEVVPVN